MKAIVFVTVFALIVALMPVCYAMTPDEVAELEAEAFGAEDVESAVPDEASELLGGAKIGDDADSLLAKLWENSRKNAAKIFRQSLKSGTAVLCAVLFASLTSSLWQETEKYASLACVITVTALALTESTSLLTLAADTLDDINLFSRTLLPVLSSAAAMSGAVTSSAAKYAVSSLLIDVLISLSNSVIMPLIYGYIAASVMSCAFRANGTESVASLLKWCAITTLTGVVLVFTLYLSVTGVISGSTDAAAVKAAKTTLTVVLPVVGSMISGAAEAIVAGAGLVKGAVGAFGMIATVAIVIVPVIQIGSNYLIYKAAGALAGSVSDGAAGRLLKEIASAYGIILGLIGSAAVMLFISIVAVIKAVT